MAKTKAAKAKKPEAKGPVDMNAYRKELLGKQANLGAALQAIQQQVQILIGQVNTNVGELKVVNRMLGRPDADLTP